MCKCLRPWKAAVSIVRSVFLTAGISSTYTLPWDWVWVGAKLTQAPERIVDLVVISVKAAHVAAAAASARGLVGADTFVLTIQNGLGSADTVAEHLGGERLLVGVAQGFGASLPEAGHAYHNDMKAIRMGAYAALDYVEVERIATLWRAAGFDAEAVADIVVMQWEKLICNAAYSAPCALTGMTIGAAMNDAEVGPITRAAATEAWSVAKACGVALKVTDPVSHVRDFAARMPAAKPSVLLDIEAGKISEVDAINGAVVREAVKAGVTAPVNQTLTRLVKALYKRGKSNAQE
jgi:2-dehydropantoate 2-reductase